MTYADVVKLLTANQSPSDWIRINNEDRDGGNTSFCIADVFLTITFGVVWIAAKPVASYQIKYGSTLIAWFEIPIGAVSELPELDKVLPLAKKHMSKVK
jgi:hypothetical protein